jgi:hypothetical protein
MVESLCSTLPLCIMEDSLMRSCKDFCPVTNDRSSATGTESCKAIVCVLRFSYDNGNNYRHQTC